MPAYPPKRCGQIVAQMPPARSRRRLCCPEAIGAKHLCSFESTNLSWSTSRKAARFSHPSGEAMESGRAGALSALPEGIQWLTAICSQPYARNLLCQRCPHGNGSQVDPGGVSIEDRDLPGVEVDLY